MGESLYLDILNKVRQLKLIEGAFSDEQFDPVNILADLNDENKPAALDLHSLSVALAEVGELNLAEKVAFTIKESDDPKLEGLALLRISQKLIDQGEFGKALQLLETLKINTYGFEIAGEKIDEVVEIALKYAVVGQKNLSLKLLNTLLDELNSFEFDSYDLSVYYLTISEAFIRLDIPNKALFFLERSIDLSKHLISENQKKKTESIEPFRVLVSCVKLLNENGFVEDAKRITESIDKKEWKEYLEAILKRHK